MEREAYRGSRQKRLDAKNQEIPSPRNTIASVHEISTAAFARKVASAANATAPAKNIGVQLMFRILTPVIPLAPNPGNARKRLQVPANSARPGRTASGFE